jgi:bifunctional non-homologous end joining protein LigD
MKPMLLTDCQDPHALIASPDWYMQEKLDGDRMMLRKAGNVVQAWTRNGERGVPSTVLALAMLSDADWLLDGELMPGNEFVVFNSVGYMPDHSQIPFKHARVASTYAEKVELFNAVQQEGGEGVVFKRVGGDYAHGCRSTDWQRWKFYESDDFTVGEVDLSKSSFEVLKDGKCYGRVACGMNRLPIKGETVRIRYDRITEKGKLLRAKLVS